jgi:hypothetical protein
MSHDDSIIVMWCVYCGDKMRYEPKKNPMYKAHCASAAEAFLMDCCNEEGYEYRMRRKKR